jgi:dethiobiotin synthetase
MSALVISGTDTGVGKTLVTAAIAAALHAGGTRVGVAKPVETGCRTVDAGTADELFPEDAATLAAAADSTEPLEVVCPYRFAEPLAPAVAAARAGTAIDFPALVRALAARASRHDQLLVEGAGGLLVPITLTESYLDLARALRAPVLLVVGSRLGAINHALLSLEILAARNVATVGYVVSRLAPDADLAVATNTASLRALTSVPCLGELPWMGDDAAALLRALRSSPENARAARARLAALARAHLDLAALNAPVSHAAG